MQRSIRAVPATAPRRDPANRRPGLRQLAGGAAHATAVDADRTEPLNEPAAAKGGRHSAQSHATTTLGHAGRR